MARSNSTRSGSRSIAHVAPSGVAIAEPEGPVDLFTANSLARVSSGHRSATRSTDGERAVLQANIRYCSSRLRPADHAAGHACCRGSDKADVIRANRFSSTPQWLQWSGIHNLQI